MFKNNRLGTKLIDLRSDTLTQPSAGMRRAMAEAQVGDDVFGEDPTVNHLEEIAAATLGKEQALYVPTGTMANLIAFLAQSRPGDSVILCADSHPYRFEAGNLARFGGLLTQTLPGNCGKIDAAEIRTRLVQDDNVHLSPTTLVSIENTTNLGGGAYYSPDDVGVIGALCNDRGLRLHCDGARLFNAAVAQGVTVAQLAAPCHSVSCCLSTGLGAPMGSLLASDALTIHEARRIRKQLGGGLRQAGIVAAAGLYALAHHVEDLADDHRRAAQFRLALEGAGIALPCPSPTNIVLITSEDAAGDTARLVERGIHVLPVGTQTIRAVFHRDISNEGLANAIQGFLTVMGT